jgi:hypothetical protein
MAKRDQQQQKKTVSGPSGPQLDLPAGKSNDIEPQHLLMDAGNLRLLETVGQSLRETKARFAGQSAIQNVLLKKIVESPIFDIGGLEASIVNNGFLKHERLIVARFNHDRYLVLEGNRRLAAVREIYRKYGASLESLSPSIRESLQTLPCFVLEGTAIDGSDEKLAYYRRAAEIYIGIRHLMGAKSWEPASRYEFQARLILQEHWTREQVAERFGRKKAEVDRDLKAQILYRDYLKFERSNRLPHILTYNAFAEAARAPSVMKWLEWSSKEMEVQNKTREATFFHYLTTKLATTARASVSDGEEVEPAESAESMVRRLRNMLSLHDEDIEGALIDRQFSDAEMLYSERKEGKFAKRIASFIRHLKRVTISELEQSPSENRSRLDELIKQASGIVDLLDGILRKKSAK